LVIIIKQKQFKYYLTMKKLNYFVLALLTAFAISCDKNKDEPPPVLGDPVIQAPSGTTVVVNESVDMNFNVNAPGKVAEVTVSASDGTATITSASIVGETTGLVTVSFTAPLTDGTETVTLTVKDAQTTPKTTNANADVTVTLKPSSSSELLVAKFTTAPVFDGEIDDMWNTAQKLESSVSVPSGLGSRNTYYNEDGIGEDALDIFEGYEGETYNFTMRSGYVANEIYFLIEWEDAVDSKDRMSWYFDDNVNLWKQQHKYANDANDKYYEDKFAFLFPIGTVDGFSSQTCYASCHSSGGVITNPKDKHTRHYLKTPGQKIDMWHWKRVRGTYADQVDDQRIYYVDDSGGISSSNGRGGDTGGVGGYSNNVKELTITGTSTLTKVPKYIIPGEANYYWIDKDQIANATAKEVMAVDAAGVLTLDDNSTIDPANGGFEKGTGTKRVPSILTKPFEGTRADIDVKYMHTGTGWVIELKRKLDTSDPDDVVFSPATDLDFGFAIFNNAAIGHGIKPGLKLKWEQ
jgi:ethylbenzene dehydrogenase